MGSWICGIVRCTHDLQSLVAYYETLARQGAIAKPGWGDYKISYAVNLNQQGEVIGILSLEKK